MGQHYSSSFGAAHLSLRAAGGARKLKMRSKPTATAISPKVKPKVHAAAVGGAHHGTSPKTTAKKKGDIASHFAASTKPTIANAIAQIKVSKFGKTKSGKYVIDKIERLHKAGKIKIADLVEADGSRSRGEWKNGAISIDTRMANNVNKIASELVHEAAHALLYDEYKRNGYELTNSVDQEAITNGYQLQLYREQRKHGFRESDLEQRLQDSNKGKLRKNIRIRYPNEPQKQPKAK